MRGKDIDEWLGKEAVGITPAYAGKREIASVIRFILEDHPRVCGEKVLKMAGQKKYKGSPPRMRGKESDTTLS